jgi:tRNA/tmRNA/rRNA uracil-C5-methylase (TrmA/RlmC/RlmD family)
MIPVPMTKSTGRKRNATSATRKGIQQRIYLRSRVMMMIVFLASTASIVKKLKKDLKSIKKAFTTVITQLAQLKEAESDIYEEEG